MPIGDEAPGTMDVEPPPAAIHGAGTEAGAVADPPPAAQAEADRAPRDGMELDVAAAPDGPKESVATLEEGEKAAVEAPAGDLAAGLAKAPAEAPAEAPAGAATEPTAAAPSEPSSAAPGEAPPPSAAPDRPPPAPSPPIVSLRPSSFDPLPHLPSLPYRQSRVLRGHASAVCSVRFDREGGRVLSASADGTACLWRVSDGALLGRIRHARKRREHGVEVPGGVSDACWFPTADMVATGGDDGVVRLWRNAGPYGGDAGAGSRSRGAKASAAKKAGGELSGKDDAAKSEKKEGELGATGAGAACADPESVAGGEAAEGAGAADEAGDVAKSAGEGAGAADEAGDVAKSAGDGGAPSSDAGGNASAEEGSSVAPDTGGNVSAEEGGDPTRRSDGAPAFGAAASESVSATVKEEDEEDGDGAKSSPAQRPRKKSKRERERERKRGRREAERLRRERKRDGEGEDGEDGGGDGERGGDEEGDGEEEGECAPSAPPLHGYALVGTLRAHTHAVTSLDASPLGSLLASASFDETVVVWSVVDCSPLRAIPAHSDPVMSVRFAPSDAARPALVSASLDGVVRVWDALGGRCLASLLAPRQAPATWAAFSANGALVVSSHVDVREAEEEGEGGRGDGKENRESAEGAGGGDVGMGQEKGTERGATTSGAGGGAGGCGRATAVADGVADGTANAPAAASARADPNGPDALAPSPPSCAPSPTKTAAVRALPPPPPEAVVWHLPERRLVRACRVPASPALAERGSEAARPRPADARYQTCRASALFRDRAGRMLALATGAEHALHAWDLNVSAAAADRGQRAWAAPEPKHVGVLRGRAEELGATGKPESRSATGDVAATDGARSGAKDAEGEEAPRDAMDLADAPGGVPAGAADARNGASAAPSCSAPEEPWGHADVILGLDVTANGVIATSAHDRDPTVRIWEPLDAAAGTAVA